MRPDNPSALRSILVACIWIGLCPATTELPVLFVADFEDAQLGGWVMSDRDAWKVVEHENGTALALVATSKYQPKVRSPHSYALITEPVVADLVLDVRLKSTSRSEPHRDLCLFFGYQDPEHFYYAHLGQQADPHAHSIFLVNGRPRVSIASERTAGTPWTAGWHRVRLVRSVETGAIEVYFDDLQKPVMRATDKTFAWGKVGVGSFDNIGLFDDLRLRGRRRTANSD